MFVTVSCVVCTLLHEESLSGALLAVECLIPPHMIIKTHPQGLKAGVENDEEPQQ